MRKIGLIAVLLAVLAGISLSAWEVEDLKLYPSCMEAGDWMLNVGAGLGVLPKLDTGYFYIPPISVSLDTNVPLGNNKLPFFFGGSVGYWGYGYHKGDVDWFYSALSIAFRFGYHFNWGVDKLDTYAVASAGWTMYLGDADNVGSANIGGIGFPHVGLNLGARWFLTDLFGFWAEAGGGSYFNLSLGLALKF